MAKGRIQIKNGESPNHPQMEERSSIPFSQEMWKGKHLILDNNTILAIEFRVKDTRIKPKQKNGQISWVPISHEWLKWRYSFLRKTVCQDEIKEKIVFLDAEFTCKNIDGEKSPVAVTILDYHGKIILDEKVCPRKQVMNVGTRFHGIVERDMRCKEDEYEILEKIQQMVKGKILIGHDLAQDIKYLHIDPDTLLGIRDLSTAIAFENLKLTKKGQFYKLSSIANELLNIEIQEKVHSSREDAETVMALYRFVEDIWKDHITF